MKGVTKVLLIGHAGKLVKLAGGIMNTHSAVADCRMEIVAAHAALAGAKSDAILRIMECVTTKAAFEILEQLGISDMVWESIGQKIGFHLGERIRNCSGMRLEYVVFTEEQGVLIRGVVNGSAG
jgi:cobalt-precorrin-5B (C1)-methyltransferase